MTRCTYDPRPLIGLPLGMFHCPGGAGQDCGCMILAGMEHGPCEPECDQADDADRAEWETMSRQEE